VDQAQEKEDKANLAATPRSSAPNTAEGKVYQYELQEKSDKGNWGLNGIWRWVKYMGWHVIILIAIIAHYHGVRIFAPAVIPIFTGSGQECSGSSRVVAYPQFIMAKEEPPVSDISTTNNVAVVENKTWFDWVKDNAYLWAWLPIGLA